MAGRAAFTRWRDAFFPPPSFLESPPCLPAQARLLALRGSDHRQSWLCHAAAVTPSEQAGLSASPGALSAFGLPLELRRQVGEARALSQAAAFLALPHHPTPTLGDRKPVAGAEEG